MGKIRTKVVETAIEPEKAEKIAAEKTQLQIPDGEKSPPAGGKPKVKPPKVRSKRYKAQVALIDKDRNYTPESAIEIIKKTATTKFDASIEAHINLGLTPDKSEHQIRTLITLPHNIGKKMKILVFSSKNAAEIKKLGAQLGTEDTLKSIESGKVNVDKIIADSDWMPRLAKVAKVLGPKGLMPNPKSGTVTDDPLKTLQEFSGGKIEIKTEKLPIIHTQIGKSSFSDIQILENYEALIQAINTARPEGVKKEYIKSIYLSSSMGPSVKVTLTPSSS